MLGEWEAQLSVELSVDRPVEVQVEPHVEREAELPVELIVELPVEPLVDLPVYVAGHRLALSVRCWMSGTMSGL